MPVTRVAASPDAIAIMLPVSVDATPEPVRSFLRSRAEQVLAAALDSRPADRDSDAAGSIDSEYVCLESLRAGADRGEESKQSPPVLPRDVESAKRAARRAGVREPGSLPWKLMEHYDALVRAWRANDEAGVVRASGAVCRLALQAALPFNTVCAVGDEQAGALSENASTSLLAEDRSVAARLQAGLMRRLRAQLAYEVRVFPERYELLGDPFKEVCETAWRANEAVGDLIRADRAALDALRISDADSFSVRSDAYYLLLSKSAGGVIRTRLEDGALLAAKLLGTAWYEAGRPSIPLVPAEVAKVEASSGDEEVQSVPEALVGSRNSDKYHRAGCPHVRRIREENLVRFDSIEDAENAGRKPCSVCRPDEAPSPSDGKSK
ncbi:MAG: hypothetical protein J5J06_07025 [Phycisphaerae bacterium]|nr:hypothetical protein [Phycisphaerae bacterium]